MLPFDMTTLMAPDAVERALAVGAVPPPVVKDFDPDMETLTFNLSAEDADAAIYLRDLIDEDGVRVEVGGRTLVVLMGVSSYEIGPNALEFIYDE